VTVIVTLSVPPVLTLLVAIPPPYCISLPLSLSNRTNLSLILRISSTHCSGTFGGISLFVTVRLVYGLWGPSTEPERGSVTLRLGMSGLVGLSCDSIWLENSNGEELVSRPGGETLLDGGGAEEGTWMLYGVT
jgi:hypothetical protein